ncbi:sugar phosphate isomerase/epimerase family protein [Bacillus niameyensis]|uniref:sugar phosphate isomerase/epimerase family protein n=1 Tax=Bacillus niameyensis TaxID=1522308 RepID=UPI000782AC9F|nr:sugar phosphate isomerase/epimerase family protein [Bacillus niameyensis]
MFKYSVSQWIYGNENIEETLQRLSKYQYDGIELKGEPDSINLAETKELLKRYELSCSSICGIYTAERDLASADETVRNDAIEYVKKCVDLAKALDASTVIVVPTTVGKHAPKTEEAWNYAVTSLRVAGEYAEQHQITIAIEALNRYETYLVTNLTEAMAMAEQVNISSVKVMADLFHMNLEERNMLEAFSLIEKSLAHVHIADNTREAAGIGQTDFAPVITYLKNMEYNGYITMEFLPGQNKDEFTKQSIDHLKKIEARIYS